MFFKKNKKKEEAKPEEKQVNIPAIQEEIKRLSNLLNESTLTNRVEVLNNLGELNIEIKNFDEAIRFYELSLLENPGLGKASTMLMKLYNIKRKEAAQQKNDDMVKKYMDKINDLMKQSKDRIRGRI